MSAIFLGGILEHGAGTRRHVALLLDADGLALGSSASMSCPAPVKKLPACCAQLRDLSRDSTSASAILNLSFLWEAPVTNGSVLRVFLKPLFPFVETAQRERVDFEAIAGIPIPQGNRCSMTKKSRRVLILRSAVGSLAGGARNFIPDWDRRVFALLFGVISLLYATVGRRAGRRFWR